ncbi:MAG: hypothetical protein QOI82_1247, partial [Actinomycetota bacterium]|nr:hypothetical protein [Actinomycetota bacterium]
MHSDTWIWAVVGGLALAGLLLFHILSSVMKSLPAEVRAPITASTKANSRPLAVLAVIVLWTATYALYSVAHLTQPTTTAAASAQDGAGTTTAAGTTTNAPTAAGSSAPLPGGAVTGAVSGPTVTGTSGAARTSTSTGSSNPTVANSTVFGGAQTKPAQSYHDSNLYKPGAANIRGITKDSVVVCGHAPLTLGYAINTKPEDELVFWNYLNANGGIYGRKFNV